MTAESAADYLGQAFAQALTRLRKPAGSTDPAAGYRSVAHYLTWFLGELEKGLRPATSKKIQEAAQQSLDSRLQLDRQTVLKMLEEKKRLISHIADDVTASLPNQGLFCAKEDARRAATKVLGRALNPWGGALRDEFHPDPQPGEDPWEVTF